MGGIGAVIVIALVAALIAAAILLATNAGKDSDAGKFIGDTVDESINGLVDYIEQNTGE